MKNLTPMLLVLGACDPYKIALGQGGDDDARLYADVYTWQCEERTETDTTYYDGVFSYEVSLEYAPDDLTTRKLPVTGCSAGLDMFPKDAGSGGTDIPDADSPSWANGDSSGALQQKSDGFYYDDVFGSVENCAYAEELIGEGTDLTAAGVFSGARTPKAGTLDAVKISNYDEATGLVFGQSVDVTWTSEGWQDAWVQIRAESGGELVDSVTCNTGGASAYAVDEDVWGLMNTAIDPDVTNLYVTVQNADTLETEDGQKIEVVTRVIHAAVVH